MKRWGVVAPPSSCVKRALAGIGALALAAMLGGCGSDNPTAGMFDMGAAAATDFYLNGQFVGAGASTQQSAMEAWIAYFQFAQPDVSVLYDPNGSGAGRTQFLDGGALWAGSDVVLTDAEMDTALHRCGPRGAIDLPVYVSPIAIAFNLPGIEHLNLGPEVIAGLFTGRVSNWSDPAIAADNPGVALPNLAVTPIHRTDNSGTTVNFTEYLSVVAPQIWPWEPAGTWPQSGGESAQGNSGVMNVVTSTNGGITYVDYSQVGLLGTASVKVGDAWVPVSAEGAAAAVDASPGLEGRGEHDLAIDIDRATTAEGAYPLVLISYAVVCLDYPAQMEADFIKSYLTWVTSEPGQELAATVAGSSPISAGLREQIGASLAAIGAGAGI